MHPGVVASPWHHQLSLDLPSPSSPAALFLSALPSCSTLALPPYQPLFPSRVPIESRKPPATTYENHSSWGAEKIVHVSRASQRHTRQTAGISLCTTSTTRETTRNFQQLLLFTPSPACGNSRDRPASLLDRQSRSWFSHILAFGNPGN